ncbi:MAG TPA: hypothetical protein VKP11_10870, partial [Frankiaceae bacterium]|nr:hypothetical protein [Frankiaceae bacterium]
MTASAPSTEPARATVAVVLPEPERGEVVAALDEAGFEAIPLPATMPLAEAFGPGTHQLIAVLDVAGDVAAAAANVATARRGRPGALSVVFVATEDDLDALQSAGLDEADELMLRPFSVDA